MFWFGDLNYRIESSVAALEVLDHAVSRRLAFLAANDQLNSARGAGDAFEGFYEGERGSRARAWISTVSRERGCFAGADRLWRQDCMYRFIGLGFILFL